MFKDGKYFEHQFAVRTDPNLFARLQGEQSEGFYDQERIVKHLLYLIFVRLSLLSFCHSRPHDNGD